MIIKKVLDIPPQPVAGARGVTIRWVFSKADGVPSFAMRFFHMNKGATIERHSHDWEHEIYVLKGRIEISAGEEKAEISTGDAVYVPPNVPHSYRALEESEFLCMIPIKGVP